MTPWTYILIGFFSFPILAILFLIWVRIKSQVTPVLVRDVEELQAQVRDLYQTGKNQDTWYILDQSTGFLVRLIKYERKSKKDTIRIEVRASDKNEKLYLPVKSMLSKEKIEFDESLTPKRREPSKLLIKNDEGGIITIGSVSRTISKIMATVGSKEFLISDRDPHFWTRKTTVNKT